MIHCSQSWLYPSPMGPTLPASAALTLKLRTSLSGQGPAQGPTQGHPDAVRTRDRKIFYQCFKMRSSALSYKRVAPVFYFTVIFTHQKSICSLQDPWKCWAEDETCGPNWQGSTQLDASGITLINGYVLQDPWTRNPWVLQLQRGQNLQGAELPAPSDCLSCGSLP